jgi:hypothetical protein
MPEKNKIQEEKINEVKELVDLLLSFDSESRREFIKFSKKPLLYTEVDRLVGQPIERTTSSPVRDAAWNLICEVVGSDRWQLKKTLFAKLKIASGDTSTFTEIRNLLNKAMTDFELEISNHGLNRTFRFWSEAEKEEYFKNSVRIIDALQTLGLQPMHFYGTLLGIIRDGHLIPHDDDIDIVVPIQRSTFLSFSKAEIIQEFTNILQTEGIRVVRDFDNHLHILYGNHSKPIDLFFATFTMREVQIWPGRLQDISINHIYPTQNYQIYDSTATIPHNPEEVLNALYGGGWRTKNELFSHWDGVGNRGKPLKRA